MYMKIGTLSATKVPVVKRGLGTDTDKPRTLLEQLDDVMWRISRTWAA
jgi:hypothetical protein